MLNMNHVTVTYNDRPTLIDFDLHMKQGEIVSLVGESGSGKTTAIRALFGLLPHEGYVSDGDILFEGESLLSKSEDEMARLRGSRISMIFQDSGAMINPIRRIGAQFVEYIRKHEKISKKEAYRKGVAMLEAMRLPDGDNIMRSYGFQLSGGMRQRVGIAMAMTFRPDLLLADEPTSALDVTTQAQIVRQMMDLNKKTGTSIIIVTHNLGVAAYMSDRILVMQNGRIVEQGDREQILKHPQQEYTQKLLAAIPTMEGEAYV
ncbi:MAG: ABC transporter ATP-binding protein [Oscillospiraceae bacterium]|nr:ABC transporter ATP-binding protein [Oscillospiraceae bacterium]